VALVLLINDYVDGDDDMELAINVTVTLFICWRDLLLLLLLLLT